MPTSPHRTLYISLSAIALIFLTALTLTPRPDLKTLSIPSPFTQSHDQPPHQCLHQRPTHPPQQGPLPHQHQQQDPPWLLATISAYTSQRRRNIIRATWQTLYADPAFDTRFVIAQPSPLWLPLIKHENDTYGDLIVLDQLNESAAVANTIKSIEFFKHLVARSAAQTPWKFVSKIDDDSFLSARRFYTDFLLPRLHPHPAATADDDDDDDASTGTLIARRLRTRADRNFSAPGGQFYTLSWDLVRLVAATHTQNPITHLPEDVLIGRLLSDAHARFEFVELDDRQAFDVDEQMQRVGMEKEVLGEMDEAAVNPHKMKDDESYLRVAGLFGRDGFVGEEVGSSAEFGDGKGDVGIDG